MPYGCAAEDLQTQLDYGPWVADKMRFEGLTLTVESVEASLAFYSGKLGLAIGWSSVPAFAMVRVGAGTIGLLSVVEARKEGVEDTNPIQKRAIHVEFTTDDLDGLYEELKAKGVDFHQPPHDEPWERSMTAFDRMGMRWSSRKGSAGRIRRSLDREGCKGALDPELY